MMGLVVEQHGGNNQQREAQRGLQWGRKKTFPLANDDLQHHHHHRQQQCLSISLQKNMNGGRSDTENCGVGGETTMTPLVKEEDLTNQQ